MSFIPDMADKIFVDTNILVYAHDPQAGQKQRIAAQELEDLWTERKGVLSLQVLQEFYVTLTQKVARPLPTRTVASLVEVYGYWEVVSLQVKDILEAVRLQKKHTLSFWDALIVQAALVAQCTLLLSEDMKHGQKIGPLSIQNPFFSIGDL